MQQAWRFLVGTSKHPAKKKHLIVISFVEIYQSALTFNG